MSDDQQPTDRSSLEAQADRVRAKLATTLERLDRKRHEIAHLADVPAQIEEHVVPIAAGAALVLVATGALATWAVIRMATASSRRPHDRLEALRRAWYHPENVGRRRDSVLADMLRKLAFGVATTAAMTLARKAMRNPRLAAALPGFALPAVSALEGAGRGSTRKRRKRARPSAPISGARIAVDDLESGSIRALTSGARTGDAS